MAFRVDVHVGREREKTLGPFSPEDDALAPWLTVEWLRAALAYLVERGAA